MKRTALYKLLLSLCILLITLPTVAFAEESIDEVSANVDASLEYASNDETLYLTDDGLEIISHVDTWRGDKLPGIVEELYKNRHGLEMEYLDRVEIYNGTEPNGNQMISASYEQEQQQIGIPVNLAGFVPEDYELKVNVEKGVIRIYKGEERENIAEFAEDLSHEYGHHFSFFHFEEEFTTGEFKESEYYQIRGLDEYPQVNGEVSHEREIHRWSIFELVAEDYFQLLGSPTGKGITRFLDISQKMGNTTYQPINSVSALDFNAVPQANWEIPLASQVDGLRNYFLSFLGETPDKTAMVHNNYNRSNDMLDITKNVPELTHRMEKQNGFTQHIIEWEPFQLSQPLQPYQESSQNSDSTDNKSTQPVYTLVALDSDNRLIPIRTVYPGEKTMAVIGTVTQVIDPYIYYYQDGLDEGSLSFRLYMQYPDGQVVAGEPFEVDFSYKEFKNAVNADNTESIENLILEVLSD